MLRLAGLVVRAAVLAATEAAEAQQVLLQAPKVFLQFLQRVALALLPELVMAVKVVQVVLVAGAL
jgi:hypothetical protein